MTMPSQTAAARSMRMTLTGALALAAAVGPLAGGAPAQQPKPAAPPSAPAPPPAAAPAPAASAQPLKGTVGETQTGLAGYYGDKLKGHRTASGERYSPDAMTTAHQTLPFGTKVKITNPKNGKSVVLRVNDRGPTQPNRSWTSAPRRASSAPSRAASPRSSSRSSRRRSRTRRRRRRRPRRSRPATRPASAERCRRRES